MELAALGFSGVVTQLNIPYVRGSVAEALGGGGENNVLGRSRRKAVSAMQEGLDKFESTDDTVAEILGALMELAMNKIGILQTDENDDLLSVTTQCLYFDNTTNVPVGCTSEDPKPTSVMWSLPFGQKFIIEIPMDFDIAPNGFPMEISFDGDANDIPTLEIGWAFDLAFGFDEEDG